MTCAHNNFSLRDLRRQIQHFCIDRDEQVARATRALESVAPARIRRADVSSHQQLLEDIQAGLAKLRKENDKSAPYNPSIIRYLIPAQHRKGSPTITPGDSCNPPPKPFCGEIALDIIRRFLPGYTRRSSYVGSTSNRLP